MLELDVSGMTCAHCERAVEAAVRRIAPEAAVEVDRGAGIVRVKGEADAGALVRAIEAQGYGAARRG